jgi:hypothetical protein
VLRAIYTAGERDPVDGALNKAVPISKTASPMSSIFCAVFLKRFGQADVKFRRIFAVTKIKSQVNLLVALKR